LCPSCEAFLNKNYIYVPLEEEYLSLFRADMRERMQKYQEIFQPSMHYGAVHIDPKNGLFACCDEYIPGKIAVYSFDEFDFGWTFKVSEFKKVKKEYTAIGRYELSITDYPITRVGKGHGYSIFDVPVTEKFQTGVEFYGDAGSSDDRNFYSPQPDYVDGMNEIIHQYFRNADDIRFNKLQEENECESTWSGTCTWLLYNGDVRDITGKRLTELYFLSNLKYSRSSEDEKEVKACARLDRAFACGLARCADNADMEYKQAWVDVYFDIITEAWSRFVPASKPPLFSLYMEAFNEEFRKRIGARPRARKN